ncbi:MAG TPA: LamG domain-containing protein [Bacteroidia bacterium]|nr:LamG domain-containing protein [Bacteroidia bacterium]
MKKSFTILLLLFSALNVSAQSIHDSLVAFYPFNGNANDASGKGNNGAVNGAILTTDRFGNSNSAYEFDGSNDYIQVSNSTSLDLNYKFSVSVWFYQTDASTAGYRLIDKNTAGFPDGYGIDTRGDATGKTVRMYFKNQDPDANSLHSLNSWNHIVITYDSLEIKFYLNGQLENTVNIVGSDAPANNLPLLIGCGQNGTNRQDFFKGKIDDLRIYSRTLSSTEVTMLFSGPISVVNEVNSQHTALVFPNPTSTGTASLDEGFEVIGVTNIIGQHVNFLFDIQYHTVTISEPKGIYLIQVKDKTTGSIQTVRLSLE